MTSTVRMYRPAPDFPLRSAESSNIFYDALDGSVCSYGRTNRCRNKCHQVPLLRFDLHPDIRHQFPALKIQPFIHLQDNIVVSR